MLALFGVCDHTTYTVVILLEEERSNLISCLLRCAPHPRGSEGRVGRGEDETVGNVTYNLGVMLMQGGAGATRAVVTHSHVPPRISGIPDIIVG